MKRKALGKGLDSLIPSAPPKKAEPQPATARQGEAHDGFLEIDVDLIRPNPRQPRKEFDQASLDELAKSLAANGVLQPIAVRRAGEKRFEILAGERRWRAAQWAGLKKIPAVLHEVEDEQLLEIALVENLQRDDLNPMEEAEAYRVLMEDLEISQTEVARKVGKKRATISNMLRLLGLPKEVQDRVRTGEISMGHARALVSVAEPRRQIELAGEIARRGLSVRQVERMATILSSEPARARRSTSTDRDPNVAAAESELQTLLGTRVRIVQGKTGAGRLELHFYSGEELEHLYDLVRDAASRKPAPAGRK